MLSIFPIQFLAPLALLLLRLCVGIIFIYLSATHIRHRHTLQKEFIFRFFPYGLFVVWYLSVWECIIGILLIIGFLTQIAALCGALVSFKMCILHKRFTNPLIPQRITYILLTVCFLSLFIMGAGAFAIDLPL